MTVTASASVEVTQVCVICAKPLRGRQGKFCGRSCKNRYTNYHHQSYERQQERGRERKLKLIATMGGQCTQCGYNRNYAALEFHHVDPGEKLFQLHAFARQPSVGIDCHRGGKVSAALR